MKRKQLKRDRAILKRLENLKPGECQIDIAKEFGVSPSMISWIKKNRK